MNPKFRCFEILAILERSLNQSREPLIREVCTELDRLIDHRIRVVSDDSKVQDDGCLQERAAIEKTLIIILSVKKIKSDLHTQ